jgi:hypothetical protein
MAKPQDRLQWSKQGVIWESAYWIMGRGSSNLDTEDTGALLGGGEILAAGEEDSDY